VRRSSQVTLRPRPILGVATVAGARLASAAAAGRWRAISEAQPEQKIGARGILTCRATTTYLGTRHSAASASAAGMTTTSHLVCLFCVTAGQNGENLGSDEEQIVLFVYLLYDIANNKVGHRMSL